MEFNTNLGSISVSLRSEFRVVMYKKNVRPLRCPHKKRCSVSLNLQLFVGVLLSYLRYLCLFVHSGVQRILRSVFLRLCQFLWIVHF